MIPSESQSERQRIEPSTMPGDLPGGWKLFEQLGTTARGPIFRGMRPAEGYTQVAAIEFFERVAPPLTERRAPLPDHPNIVRLLDVGPGFLAMELVDRAQPLLEYCAGLRTRERLRLFLKICAAIRHGHRHGIAHGSLNASNVLVTSEGEPKLLDFAMSETPGSVAADLHALGVLLSEITAVSNRSVARDLRAIAEKAGNAAEPPRGYETAEQLAADIQRYLDGLPVLARESTWHDRAAKWVSRHKAASVIAAMLTAAIVGLLWLSIENRKALRLAEAQLRETREIAGTMAMQVPRQLAAVQGSLPLRRKMLRFGLARLDQLLADRDPSDAKQRRALALGYFDMAGAFGGASGANVGDYDAAIQSYRKAIDLLWEDPATLPRDASVLGAMRFAHGGAIVNLRRLRRLSEALKAAEDCIVKAPLVDRATGIAVALGCRLHRVQILADMGKTVSDFEVDELLAAPLDASKDSEFAAAVVNAQLRLASLQLDKKQYDKALDHAKQGLDFGGPKNRTPELSLLKMRLMVAAALAEYRSGRQDAARARFDECFDVLREIVRREPSDVESRGELARALFESLETIPDDIGLHHARMVEAESLANAIVKDIDYPEGRFLLVRILGKQAELQNNDCALRQRALDEYRKIADAGLALPGDKPHVDEIRNRACGGSAH